MFKSFIVRSLVLSTLTASSVLASATSYDEIHSQSQTKGIHCRIQYFEELIKKELSSDEVLKHLDTHITSDIKGFRGTIEQVAQLTPAPKITSPSNPATNIQKYQELKKQKVDPLFKQINENFKTFKDTQDLLFQEYNKLLSQTLHNQEQLNNTLAQLNMRKTVLMNYINDFEKGFQKEYITLTLELANPHLPEQTAEERIKHLNFLANNALTELDKLSDHAVKGTWINEQRPSSPTKLAVNLTVGFNNDVLAETKKKAKDRSDSMILRKPSGNNDENKNMAQSPVSTNKSSKSRTFSFLNRDKSKS